MADMSWLQDLNWLQEHKVAVSVAAGIGVGVCCTWLFRGRSSKALKQKVAALEEIAATTYDDSDMKMVFVVRTDLKMGKGKIAAQCAHAAVLAYEGCGKTNPELLHAWRDQGQAKVVTRCNTLEELRALATRARELGLGAYMVRDAGRTQIQAGSITVLAVGPGPSSLINDVTGEQKLM